jgi:hypothetical protein
VGRLRYVLAHGVKEGLVERSAEWPGLTCLPQLLGPARRLVQWFSWTKRWGKRKSEDLEAGEGRFAEEIAEPVELVVEPLPCWKGHASTRQALKELREQYRAFVAVFREAAARWRWGDFSAPFPPFSFPPRVVPGLVTRIL